MIAAVEDDAALALGSAQADALKHRPASIEIGPAAGIGERDMEGRADRLEQRLQIDLLDQHLEVDILVVPERERYVIEMSPPDAADDPLGLLLRCHVVEVVQIVEAARPVLRDDIHREKPLPPTLGKQLLGDIEVALAEAMLLEQVAPASRRDLKIKSKT